MGAISDAANGDVGGGSMEYCLPDQDTQCTEGCHENCGRKGICSEIGNFSNGDYHSTIISMRLRVSWTRFAYE